MQIAPEITHEIARVTSPLRHKNFLAKMWSLKVEFDVRIKLNFRLDSKQQISCENVGP
jgi:hypothetical protein